MKVTCRKDKKLLLECCNIKGIQKSSLLIARLGLQPMVVFSGISSNERQEMMQNEGRGSIYKQRLKKTHGFS